MDRRRVVRVPASSANLGPGFDCMAAAVGLHLQLEVRETGQFAIETDLPVARGRENLCVRAFEALHPADGFTFHDRLRHPPVGRPRIERGGDRRGADGGRPPVRARRRPARARNRAGGSPRQRRRGAAWRVRHLRRRLRHALRSAHGPGGDRGRARAARCARSAAREALPDAGAAERGRVQRRPRLAAHARAGPRRLGPGRARPARPPAPVPPRAPLSPLI